MLPGPSTQGTEDGSSLSWDFLCLTENLCWVSTARLTAQDQAAAAEKSQAIFFISKSNGERTTCTVLNHWIRAPSPENLAEPQHQSLCHVVGKEGVIFGLFWEGLGLGFFFSFCCFCIYNDIYWPKYREKKAAIKVGGTSEWQGFWFSPSFPPLQPHLSLICHLIPEHMSLHCIDSSPKKNQAWLSVNLAKGKRETKLSLYRDSGHLSHCSNGQWQLNFVILLCLLALNSSETPTMKLEKNYFLYQIILPDSAAFKTYKIYSSKSWLWNAIHLLSAMWLQVTSIKQATQPWRNSRALPKRIPVTDKKWKVFLTICQSQPGYFSLPKAQSCMIMENKNPLQPDQCASPGLPQQVRTPGIVSNSHIRLYISHFGGFFGQARMKSWISTAPLYSNWKISFSAHFCIIITII